MSIAAIVLLTLLAGLMAILVIKEISLKSLEHVDPIVAEKHRYLKRLEMELSVAEDLDQPAATLNDLNGRIAEALKELEVAILNYEHGKSLNRKSPKTDKLRNIKSPSPDFAAQVRLTPATQERHLRTQDAPARPE